MPAGAIIRVDLTRVLAGRSGTLDLTSDVPVTGGARAAWGGARRDVVWLAGGAPASADRTRWAGRAVPSGPGLTTTVTVAAPDGEVRGTLTVITTESDDLAVLSGRSGDGRGDRRGRGGSGGQSDEPGAGLPELVLPRDPARTETIPVTVPAGSQSAITLPDGGAKAPVGPDDRELALGTRVRPGGGVPRLPGRRRAAGDRVPLVAGRVVGHRPDGARGPGHPGASRLTRRTRADPWPACGPRWVRHGPPQQARVVGDVSPSE